LRAIDAAYVQPPRLDGEAPKLSQLPAPDLPARPAWMRADRYGWITVKRACAANSGSSGTCILLGELARERLIDAVRKKLDPAARIEGGYREVGGQGYLILSAYSVGTGSELLAAANQVYSSLRSRPTGAELKRALAILDQRAAWTRAHPPELTRTYAAYAAAGRRSARDFQSLEAGAKGATPELLQSTAESAINQEGQLAIEETGGDR
jgi:hypothetical protein